MRLERDVGFFRFLRLFCAPRYSNLLDRRSGDPRRFSRKFSFLHRRLGRIYSLWRRSSRGTWLRFLVTTANRKQVLYNPKKKEVKKTMELAEILTTPYMKLSTLLVPNK
jgi:hypothetical protein